MSPTRLFRTGWVLVINGITIYLIVYGSSDVRAVKSYLGVGGGTPTLSDFARGVIPGAGIFCELLGSRIAGYVNTGYFAIASCVLAVLVAFNWTDYRARGYLLVLCVAALFVSVVDAFLYFWSTNAQTRART